MPPLHPRAPTVPLPGRRVAPSPPCGLRPPQTRSTLKPAPKRDFSGVGPPQGWKSHGRRSRVSGARSRGPADLGTITDTSIRAAHGGAAPLTPAVAFEGHRATMRSLWRSSTTLETFNLVKSGILKCVCGGGGQRGFTLIGLDSIRVEVGVQCPDLSRDSSPCPAQDAAMLSRVGRGVTADAYERHRTPPRHRSNASARQAKKPIRPGES